MVIYHPQSDQYKRSRSVYFRHRRKGNLLTCEIDYEMKQNCRQNTIGAFCGFPNDNAEGYVARAKHITCSAPCVGSEF